MPARIKRERTRGWRKGAAVIVDRTSRYGNPFVIVSGLIVQSPDAEPYNGRQWTCDTNEDARKWAAELYDDWLNGTGPDVYRVNGRTYDRRRVLANLELGVLTGRDLACTCPIPEPGQSDHCHGQPLLRRANPTELRERTEAGQ